MRINLVLKCLVIQIEKEIGMYDDILLFINVVELGSFSKTAIALNLTQSTVSRRISNIESRLKVELLRRNTHSIELTEAGKIMFEECKSLPGSFERAINKAQAINGLVNGQLRVSLPWHFADKLISPHIGKFLLKNPGINLTINYHYNEIINMLEENLDLAIVNYLPEQQTQKFKLFYRSKLILCCTPEYFTKHGELSIENSDTLDDHIITSTLNKDGTMRKIAKAYHEYSDQVLEYEVSTRLVLNNIQQCLTMVLSGDVIAVVAEFQVEDLLKEGRLVRIFPEFHLGLLNYYLLRNTQTDNAKSKCFIKFLEECLT